MKWLIYFALLTLIFAFSSCDKKVGEILWGSHWEDTVKCWENPDSCGKKQSFNAIENTSITGIILPLAVPASGDDFQGGIQVGCRNPVTCTASGRYYSSVTIKENQYVIIRYYMARHNEDAADGIPPTASRFYGRRRI